MNNSKLSISKAEAELINQYYHDLKAKVDSLDKIDKIDNVKAYYYDADAKILLLPKGNKRVLTMGQVIAFKEFKWIDEKANVIPDRPEFGAIVLKDKESLNKKIN